MQERRFIPRDKVLGDELALAIEAEIWQGVADAFNAGRCKGIEQAHARILAVLANDVCKGLERAAIHLLTETDAPAQTIIQTLAGIQLANLPPNQTRH